MHSTQGVERQESHSLVPSFAQFGNLSMILSDDWMKWALVLKKKNI